MNEPILLLFGMARRASKLSIGFEASTRSVGGGKGLAVFMASDLSDRSKRKLTEFSDLKGIFSAELPFTIEELSNAIGIKAGCISIEDNGFSKKAQLLYTQLNGEEITHDA